MKEPKTIASSVEDVQPPLLSPDNCSFSVPCPMHARTLLASSARMLLILRPTIAHAMTVEGSHN